MIANDLLNKLVKEIEGLVELFNKSNFKIYLVGGVVRQILTGVSYEEFSRSDVDLATDATPEQVKEVLSGFADAIWLAGEKFGTVSFLKAGRRYEVTTFRTERYEKFSRKPSVKYGKSIEEDLARRDFTVNAMAISLPDLALIDPFGGEKDLKNKILRTPLSPEISFSDDPLRLLRAARFINNCHLQPTEDLLEAAKKLSERIKIVSPERIRDEFNKVILANDPQYGIWFLINTKVIDHFLPEIPALKLQQDPEHKHKDVLVHTVEVVRRTRPVLVLRLAALLHDIGKPATRTITDQGVSFHGHDILGAKLARKRLSVLKYPNKQIDDICKLIRMHLRVHSYGNGWTDKAVRRYVRDAGELLELLNELIRADCTTANKNKALQLKNRMDELEARIEQLRKQEELQAIRPEIDGHRVMELLGLAPGKEVGKVMDWLMELRLDEGILGQEEVERRLLSWWQQNKDLINKD